MQTTGLNRDIIDKFYTKPNVAEECCQTIQKLIQIDPEIDLIIEPSAGNGSFIKPITNITQNYLFYDILPEHPEIIKQDYLNIDLTTIVYPDIHTKIHIIGNPPFGRQSSLAIKFIKQSTSFCDTISFILPKSFKKESMQKHFPLNFHLIYQVDLEDNSFIINDKEEKDVPCVFQIWEKRDHERETVIASSPIKFSFVKIDEDPDISFRRVGVNAGTIDTNKLDQKSKQSHYFIKFNPDIDKNIAINNIKKITYEHNNTVGPKSISKQLVKELRYRFFQGSPFSFSLSLFLLFFFTNAQRYFIFFDDDDERERESKKKKYAKNFSLKMSFKF